MAISAQEGLAGGITFNTNICEMMTGPVTPFRSLVLVLSSEIQPKNVWSRPSIFAHFPWITLTCIEFLKISANLGGKLGEIALEESWRFVSYYLFIRPKP